MAKTESTAVNQLIQSVQTGRPPGREPGEDLFAPPPAARVTGPIPALRGAGEVQPLPRNRAPSGTSKHQLPNIPPPVRVTTAPPTRAQTIPPLPARARATRAPQVTGPQPQAEAPRMTAPQAYADPARMTGPQPQVRPSTRSSRSLPPPPRSSQPAPRSSQQARASQPAARSSQPPAPRAPYPAESAPLPAQARDAVTMPPWGGDAALTVDALPPWGGEASPRATGPQPMTRAPLGTQNDALAKLPELPRPSRTLPPPTRTTQPSISPVAAPFEARQPIGASAKRERTLGEPNPSTGEARTDIPVAAVRQLEHTNPFVVKPLAQRPITVDEPGDSFAADNWFEASRAVERVDVDVTWNRQRVDQRKRAPLALAKKLAIPAAVLAIAGIMFGGYLAFDGEGGKKHAAAAVKHAAVPAQNKDEVAAPAPAHAASRESMNAATATAGGEQPQPPAREEIAAAPTGAAPAAAAASATAPATATAMAPAAAPATVAAPATAPAAAPATAAAAPALAAAANGEGEVHEVKTTRGVVKLVDLRIDSKPAGATITLLDGGKSTLLGNAPVVASLDPAHAYDVVFSLDGRAPQTVHVDPTKTHRIEATLHHGASGPSGSPGVKAPAVAAAPKLAAFVEKPAAKPAPAKKPAAKVVGQIADPGFDAPAEEAKPEPKAEAPKAEAPKAEAAGNGVLMVSTKPVCSILIDGKDTGLQTPQKSIPLPAGPHKITFVNAEENINKTVSISIAADKTSKLIQNLAPQK